VGREVIQTVNPFRCRMWDLHDRLEAHINEGSCRAEIESFQRHGQIVPALGRRLIGDPAHDYELICGGRRLFIARYLNKPLLIEVRSMSDREAIIAMDIENRHRQDISPYERGRSYVNWLRSGNFRSQDDIAKSLKISASQVSRLVKLARLPCVVVDAFSAASEICESWGLEIAEALEDPQRRRAIIHVARRLAAKNPRESAATVHRELVLAGQKIRTVKKPAHDEVVFDDCGAPLFRVRYQRNAVALVLPTGKLSPTSLGHIRQAICRLMQSVEGSAPSRSVIKATPRPIVDLPDCTLKAVPVSRSDLEL